MSFPGITDNTRRTYAAMMSAMDDGAGNAIAGAIMAVRKGEAALFRALDRDHGPTAYVFGCLHCGRFGAYRDIH